MVPLNACDADCCAVGYVAHVDGVTIGAGRGVPELGLCPVMELNDTPEGREPALNDQK